MPRAEIHGLVPALPFEICRPQREECIPVPGGCEQPPHVGGVGVRRVEEAGELSGGALHDPFEQPDFRLLKQIDQGRVPAVGRLADAGHLVQRVRVERALEQYGVHPLEQIAESRLERIAEKVRRAAYP